eukprot:Clim_evm60s214 gene=Clim_evmTU60s214
MPKGVDHVDDLLQGVDIVEVVEALVASEAAYGDVLDPDATLLPGVDMEVFKRYRRNLTTMEERHETVDVGEGAEPLTILLVRYEGIMIFAFRGTKSVSDWLKFNVRAMPSYMTLGEPETYQSLAATGSAAQQSKSKGSSGSGAENGIQVGLFGGFVSAFTHIRPVLKKMYDEYKDQEIKRCCYGEAQVMFCGHSLGGAIAQVAALEFQEKVKRDFGCKYPKMKCLTFGAPFIALSDTALRLHLETNAAATFFNFCLMGDPVPMVYNNLRSVGEAAVPLMARMFGNVGRQNVSRDSGGSGTLPQNTSSGGAGWFASGLEALGKTAYKTFVPSYEPIGKLVVWDTSVQKQALKEVKQRSSRGEPQPVPAEQPDLIDFSEDLVDATDALQIAENTTPHDETRNATNKRDTSFPSAPNDGPKAPEKTGRYETNAETDARRTSSYESLAMQTERGKLKRVVPGGSTDDENLSYAVSIGCVVSDDQSLLRKQLSIRQVYDLMAEKHQIMYYRDTLLFWMCHKAGGLEEQEARDQAPAPASSSNKL